ncbi:antitoxin MazE5 [Serinicoccus sp. LYQ131]|uniref:antitoxin MazE5 n=1 Tax=Serinicoccus sp. LYQ131 TaxID=3378797 RepID=UPI0038534BCA
MSTTVDAELLARAREIRSGGTDASLVEEALQALLRNHRDAELDEAYARAYSETPVEAPDEWGDLTTFLDAATRR